MIRSPDVGFVGLGNMGTAIANVVAGNGHPVLGWEHDPAVVREINVRHANTRYLAGVRLPASLKATSDIRDVFASCGTVFVAVPSAFIPQTLSPLAGSVPQGTVLVNLAKGIDVKTGRTSFAELARIFPRQPKIMLSGPSIANEIARRMPTAVMLAGTDAVAFRRVERLLVNGHFKAVRSPDAAGVELGGILKNIYAVGLGILDGCGMQSINFRSVYLTLALREMAVFGAAFGARQETFCHLAGMGDLIATSMSVHSHNRRLGEFLARGLSAETIRKRMGVLPEGYTTVRAVVALARKNTISLPLAGGLLRVMTGRRSPAWFVTSVISGKDKCS
jgi:glycerol-3-phosphate dehydrogenase (NAD(P)+)